MKAGTLMLIATLAVGFQTARAEDHIKRCVSKGKTTFTNIDCTDIDKMMVPPSEAVIPTEIKRVGKNGEILDARQPEKQKNAVLK
jgi:hypothetical protein